MDFHNFFIDRGAVSRVELAYIWADIYQESELVCWSKIRYSLSI